MSGGGFREDHAREIVRNSAVDPGLEKVVAAPPINRRNIGRTWTTKKEIFESESTYDNGEEVAPLLIIGAFYV